MQKLLLLVGFLFLATSSLRAGILANGDFSDGIAHWKGDCRVGDSGGSLPAYSDRGGIIFPLANKWTKIYQTFDTRETGLKVTIHYSTTPDYKTGQASTGTPGAISFPINMGITSILSDITKLRFQDGPGGGAASHLTPDDWLVVLVDSASNIVKYVIIKPTPGKDEQTIVATLPDIVAHEDKTFYLAFPPGAGSVNIISISLDNGKTDSDNPADLLK